MKQMQMRNYANAILGHPEDFGDARSCATFEPVGIDYDIRFMIPPNDAEVFCLNRLFRSFGFTEMRFTSPVRNTAHIYRISGEV